MKPYKIFGMSMFTLLFFAIIYNGKLNLDSNSILVTIFDSIFSFIFPAFIFFSAWLISYKRKGENKSILEFYTKVLLNVVLPYFLCMIPYIIYKFGMNNLKFNEVINLFVEGNIIKQFEYIKTIIHLLIIFPIAEYFVKLNAKNFAIVSLTLSAIFSLFSINNYIYTDVFNYLIYLTLGISFAYHGKEVTIFFRKNYENLLSDIFEVALLVFITKFDLYSFFNPIPEILYNIVAILTMTYLLYRKKIYFYNDKKYLHENILFNPPISIISIFLLIEIVLDFLRKISRFLYRNNS